MRFVQYNTAGTLAVDLDERPDAGPTFVVRLPSGGEAQTSTAATLDGVDTALAAAAAAGAATLSLASATGVTAGHRYLLGGSEAAGGEVVTVKSVSGATATLVRPLQRAAASGASFESARVTMAVAAAAVQRIARHYHAELTYTVGAAARPVVHVPFDVTRYVPFSALSLENVRALDPLFAKRLAAGTHWPDLREAAWDLILARIAATKAPGALVGTLDLTIPHGYAVRMLVAETAGQTPEQAAARDDLRTRFAQELDACLARAAFDDDGDQAKESHERFLRHVPVMRG
jgi:hypothetical protein